MSIRRPVVSTLLLLSLSPALAAAQGGESRTHTVKAGDTLWDLAQQYLGDAFKWPEIYRRNQSTIQDPNLIYPDQVIIILGEVSATAGTPADSAGAGEVAQPGQPGQSSTDSTMVVDTLVPRQAPLPVPTMTIFNPDRFRVVRGQRMALRVQEPAAAVRTGDYLQAPFMWDAAGVKGAGRVTDGTSTDGIGAYNVERPIQYMERLYIRVPEGSAGKADDRYLVFRYGPTVEGQGRVVVPTGIVKVTADAANGRAQAVLLAKFEDVFTGQDVMPLDTLAMQPGVFPSRVEFGVATTVTYIYGDPVLPPVGHQIIFGAKASDGVVPGDQLTLQIAGSVAADGSVLPAQEVAIAQVTRVTPWGASAIIISQTDSGIKTGMAARVSGKMP
jgi:LysM repeat protein